jgi:hypothetical protein
MEGDHVNDDRKSEVGESWASRDLGKAMMGYNEPAGASEEADEPLMASVKVKARGEGRL